MQTPLLCIDWGSRGTYGVGAPGRGETEDGRLAQAGLIGRPEVSQCFRTTKEVPRCDRHPLALPVLEWASLSEIARAKFRQRYARVIGRSARGSRVVSDPERAAALVSSCAAGSLR